MTDIDTEGLPTQDTNGAHSSVVTTATVLDPTIVLEYLSQLLSITLGATREELEAEGSLLSASRLSDTISKCTRFLNELQVALYAQKHAPTEDGSNNSDAPSNGTNNEELLLPQRHVTYTLASTLTLRPSVVASVAILKRPQPIDLALPLSNQLQIINLPTFSAINGASTRQQLNSSPYESLYSVVRSALTPYFDAVSKGDIQSNELRQRSDADQRIGIPGAKKKLAELELTLLQLQQNAEIPQLSLPLHPEIQSALDKAEVKEVSASVDLIPTELLGNSTFHNSLQTIVNGWIKSIQAITKTNRDVWSGTATQEINFWLDMEHALEDVEKQLRSDGVVLTMDVLKHAKRYLATTSFSTDTGLKETVELVQKYNGLMREFPIDELLSAPSLEKIQEALDLIFAHINKKLRICPYPIKRALALVEAISSDLDGRLHDLLNGRLLMQMSYREFEETVQRISTIWLTWDSNIKEFTSVVRELTRRRNERFVPIRINNMHARTQDRLDYIATFRKNHEQLQRTIKTVLSSGDVLDTQLTGIDPNAFSEDMGGIDAVEEVAEAFSELRDVDVMDVSETGTAAWDRAEMIYNERTSRVENSIIARLRDRLATAKTANEMFRVFSKFNALFVRPKIRGAISEYQTQLIDNVKHDISALHERFKLQYGHSQAHAMAQLHDLPPVSGSIIWARQIERQLDGYMKKVEDVLGTQWHLHAEGQKLNDESQNFRKKLDTRPVFQTWISEVSRRDISISGRLFSISKNRASGNSFELGINFDSHVITLFKEVRNLLWLNFSIPHRINNVSKEAKRVYPYAVSLMESVRSFLQTSQMISTLPDVAVLLNGHCSEVQTLIAKGVPLKWESFINAYDLHMRHIPGGHDNTKGASAGPRSQSKHVQFVRDFAHSVSGLQSKTNALSAINETAQKNILHLQNCNYRFDVFQRELGAIQTSVDQLSLQSFTNLRSWVKSINVKVLDILRNRLDNALVVWMEAFEDPEPHMVRPTSAGREKNFDAEEQVDLYDPRFQISLHEISMRNQTISLEPPLEYARSAWLAQLHEWLGHVCDLQEIQSSRYEISMLETSRQLGSTKFDRLLILCAERISYVYSMIDKKIAEVSEYIEKWLQFQSLWDLQSEVVYEVLGDDLQKWLQLLQEIRQTRSTFDTSTAQRSFGLMNIDYEQVQMKINAKYDLWQNEILQKFSAKLASVVNETFTSMESMRRDLENSSLETSSTAQAVAFITVVQNAKRKAETWGADVELFRKGQTLLARQRFQFPTDWIDVQRIEDEYSTLNEILDRKVKIISDQTDALRAKVDAEDKVISGKSNQVIADWNEQRPVSGSIPAQEASRLLSDFESRVTKLNTEVEMLARAKEALGLAISSQDSSMVSLLEEVQDFKSVWAGLSTIWDALNDLRDMPWTSVQPRKLRQSLEGLITMSKDMPSRMRQYAAFDYLQSSIKQLLKANTLLSELRSDAFRERHWIRLFKSLKPSKRYSAVAMTLGDVWDLNLASSESVIRDVIMQAQGEMALEEFLRQVRETWQNYALDLVNYQNKCRLIRGWDDLFAKCSENLNSLQAMRYSPYYKEFEEEASSWEEKLNRIYVLFDIWIDVQRQWIYLEGVFSGNADIKQLLPMESARFGNINSEFFAIMKKVQKSSFVLDILAISGVQKSLERLADLLHKIQKALGEYLERERMSFPRFYFVGDEDLLEIIGNSSDTTRISRHLGKMFAGVAGLIMGEEQHIVGVRSPQGEEIALVKNISLVQTPRINEWLGQLDRNVKETLAQLLAQAVENFAQIFDRDGVSSSAFQHFTDAFPVQISVLAGQVWWTQAVENALNQGGSDLETLRTEHEAFLGHLAAIVIQDLDPVYRKKCEHLVAEFVHQRDVIENLIAENVESSQHHLWLLQMRYVYDTNQSYIHRLRVEMADASIEYGFEYLGVLDRLVRTPLTDSCFLTMTQALAQRLGGSPYGPAGTGKTETVKALGVQLGRFTLVFNCDDTFDFQAMGRIFLGICQVGAWGCFDEFNRLEERILSAVSQQIQNIQLGLKRGEIEKEAQIELVGRQLQVNPDTGIFITMNPGYAGRSNLPDNLKKLFRSVAMSKPDKELIAEVTLYSQGFNKARDISKQIVPFFEACSKRLSAQTHYDFGLRALKSVLVNSGGLKRNQSKEDITDPEDSELEPQIIVQSLRETIGPKLIRQDADTMEEIEGEMFPGVKYRPAALTDLRDALQKAADERQLVVTEDWMTKTIQLYQIQRLHHGVMMVGSSGTGKSASWTALLQALHQVEGVEGVSYVIDPKVMSKEALYGSLDSTTREWIDGLFTSILRKIVDNLRGESAKRHWIIFDGDVDPEWVENLNSVLDDNKLLTLPNGERLVLPPNVRILFEVESLKYATLATVSRCGMVWFSETNVTVQMMVKNYLGQLRAIPFDDIDDDSVPTSQLAAKTLEVQNTVAVLLETHFSNGSFLEDALSEAASLAHIMEFTQIRALTTLFSLLNQTCKAIILYNVQHSDLQLSAEQIEAYVSKRLLLAIVWSMSGDCPLAVRQIFGANIAALTTVDLPGNIQSSSIIDFEVTLPDATWNLWQSKVPTVEVNTHSITQTDIVIPTLDTIRHEDLLYSWLSEHKPLMLCGPPGSGKTMTLFSALRKLPDMEIVGLNFSSATTPDLLLKSFEQHCEYKKTLNGVVLSPTQIGRWLVIFCDEINLPAPDKYGTQRVISFMRQLIECNGFWRTSDKTWVTLDRIQFVGACNPPTDAGRNPLGDRYLRHAPLIMVDYPGETSLQQIYGAFNSAVLKITPSLRGHALALTQAMVQVYLESQQRFTPAVQPHYIYSPRELSRWVRGIYEAIKPLESLDLEALVRIWAHEALRLFQDRLIGEDERKWSSDAINRIALTHFPTIDSERALGGPMLFSNWLSKNYIPVDREQLRDFVKARLKTFCEEEVDVPLILYNDALDHVLRIDRVFRQPQGHVILIGVSGSGKTTLSRFVAWMNGLKVFQIKVHGRYSAEDFDDDLRNVLRRCGCKDEKICFIMDESNVLDSAFLERMNTLLANAEVPGLFEGDEYASLMTACKEGAQRQGLLLDSQDELYKWFTQQIVKNLHVVFTMNPPEEGLSSRAATSPALFNRCVLNWFGDWSDQALFQVGYELTQSLDLDRGDMKMPDTIQLAYRDLPLPASHRNAVVNAMVYIHHSVYEFNRRLKKQQNKTMYLTPRHFLDFTAQYCKLYNEKRDDLEEQQRHLNVGLEKLRDTVDKVKELRRSLAGKKSQLEAKEKEANEKLQKMLEDQQRAEARKSHSLEIQAALEVQDKEVKERQEVVKRDLENAEPAVREAQKSVSNIKRQQLTEVRAMTSPPSGVRLALEAVCTLLGHKVDNWKAIQAIVRKDDFIASIVNYNNELQMTPSHRAKMQSEYLASDDFTYEKVNRASKACGPLVQWVQAQVNFSEILDRVGPLREEVGQLEEKALQTRAEAKAVENNIAELESSIAVYKSEYAALISETQAIKSEMDRVEKKVSRSLHLLDSLASERKRWEEGSKSFETQLETLVGDTLTAAAFIAYAGFYDQQYRKIMVEDWLHHLSLAGIKYKTPNPVAEYLSTADERIQWQENSLPVDELCTENAIILKRFNRYPLIVDPSGRIATFLQKEYKDRRLTITSFLDDNFVKQVESALRFGNAILIQDAEYMDPVLNHVLNREYQKTGGRVLIQLGKQEIDFSPSFRLFLSTKDPSAAFTPDVCSRTTFVNFTVTQSSLQTQTLDAVLKSERPDVDERRSNLLKMQGEFRVHLRRLEKHLLQALNESRGNILDDDALVETLETVKKDVAGINEKVAETEGVMSEVDAITGDYTVIAKSCSAIFSVLDQLHHINHFYRFSLQYFLNIFETVLLHTRQARASGSHKERVDFIVNQLFATTFRRTSLTVLQQDRMTLGLLLAQASPYNLEKTLFDTLLDSDIPFVDATTENKDVTKVIEIANRVPSLQDHLEAATSSSWQKFLEDDLAENHAPLRDEDHQSLNRELRMLVLVKMIRADRLIPAAERFTVKMFGQGLFDDAGDLNELVEQTSATTPVALCCSPGFDASFKVENVVQRRGVRCAYVAMGSAEGLTGADQAISQAAANGEWVFIKNVHLALTWLQSLEKRLDTLKPHQDFRLYLSMECNSKIPVNLLRTSRVVMCEQPAGIRANLRDTLLPAKERACKLPTERTRLYLLLSILHGLIQERIRYAPTLGWNSPWEFNDSDYDCAAHVIDTWIDRSSHGRSNIAPSSVPWELIRALISTTYDGKIDDIQDSKRLSKLVEDLFTPMTFEDGFDVTKAVAMYPDREESIASPLRLPSSTSWDGFEQWVNALPEREPPAFLGLPANAEKLLLVEQGRAVVGNIAQVMRILDENEQVMAEEF